MAKEATGEAPSGKKGRQTAEKQGGEIVQKWVQNITGYRTDPVETAEPQFFHSTKSIAIPKPVTIQKSHTVCTHIVDCQQDCLADVTCYTLMLSAERLCTISLSYCSELLSSQCDSSGEKCSDRAGIKHTDLLSTEYLCLVIQMQWGVHWVWLVSAKFCLAMKFAK